MKTFDQQIDEWLAKPEAERIAIMSARPRKQWVTSEIDNVVDSDAYDVCFGDLTINKDI